MADWLPLCIACLAVRYAPSLYPEFISSTDGTPKMGDRPRTFSQTPAPTRIYRAVQVTFGGGNGQRQLSAVRVERGNRAGQSATRAVRMTGIDAAVDEALRIGILPHQPIAGELPAPMAAFKQYGFRAPFQQHFPLLQHFCFILRQRFPG